MVYNIGITSNNGVIFMTTVYTEIELARRLKVSRELLRKLRHERKTLPFIKIGARVLYRDEDIDEFLAKNTVNPIK